MSSTDLQHTKAPGPAPEPTSAAPAQPPLPLNSNPIPTTHSIPSVSAIEIPPPTDGVLSPRGARWCPMESPLVSPTESPIPSQSSASSLADTPIELPAQPHVEPTCSSDSEGTAQLHTPTGSPTGTLSLSYPPTELCLPAGLQEKTPPGTPQGVMAMLPHTNESSALPPRALPEAGDRRCVTSQAQTPHLLPTGAKAEGKAAPGLAARTCARQLRELHAQLCEAVDCQLVLFTHNALLSHAASKFVLDEDVSPSDALPPPRTTPEFHPQDPSPLHPSTPSQD